MTKNFYKRVLVFVFFSAGASFAADIVATRCKHADEDYKTKGTCWYGEFITEKGAKVWIEIGTKVQEPSESTLKLTDVTLLVRYYDRNNFFENSPKLFAYITILKTKFLNQGAPTNTSEGGVYNFERNKDGSYEVRFSSKFDNSVSLHQEIMAGLTFAFTNQFPLSGDAKWDSNSHRNHGFWLR